ncbi:MAG: BON domain-containing protein [Fibrobacteres bacterium]|nr:BON domain-containing protein [Fibrobacterota bacterium]
MQRALLFALSATLIGFTGCNKSSREKASEKSADVRQDADKAMQEVKDNAQKAADKVEKDAKQAVGEIKENAADAREKIANEASKGSDAVRNSTDKDGKTVRTDSRDDARQAKNDAKAEARQTNRDTKTEARQTNRDVHEALGMDQGKTAADKKLNDRIRAALKREGTRDAGDVTLETRDGHVRLKGTVASEDAKKAIASQARKVAGLTHVTDDIKVAERVGQGSTD